MAEAALAQLGLDRLLIIPTGQAWHKPQQLSSAEHRIAMAKLAFADLDKVEIDIRETRRNGPSYTVDTLRELDSEFPQAVFFLILGEDQARAFTTWNQWQEIARRARICVATRSGAGAKPVSSSLNQVPGHEFEPLQMQPIDLSATQIRERVRSGQSIDNLVNAPVARYIARNHLYLNIQ